MRRPTGIATACLAVLPLATSGHAQQETASLKLEPRKKFELVLPRETWIAADRIAIPHAGGPAFVTEKDGVRLIVDTDGDGRPDTKIQGAKGFAVLQAKRSDGEPLVYAVRFRQSGTAYQYATSCVMSGSLGGTSIELIDVNCNGRFDEVGTDAIVVGGGDAACYLGDVVALKDGLYRLSVDADGTAARAEPFDGPTGTLRIRGGLHLPGRLESAIVSDATGRYSFEVGHDTDVRVPVGSYKLSGGFATAGGDTARLRAGSMKPLVVEDGGTATLEAWGAPLVAEFDHTRAGADVTVQPLVRFVGRAGEEWYELLPDAKSPKLVFIDADRNRVLETKRFEGC